MYPIADCAAWQTRSAISFSGVIKFIHSERGTSVTRKFRTRRDRKSDRRSDSQNGRKPMPIGPLAEATHEPRYNFSQDPNGPSRKTLINGTNYINIKTQSPDGMSREPGGESLSKRKTRGRSISYIELPGEGGYLCPRATCPRRTYVFKQKKRAWDHLKQDHGPVPIYCNQRSNVQPLK